MFIKANNSKSVKWLHLILIIFLISLMFITNSQLAAGFGHQSIWSQQALLPPGIVLAVIAIYGIFSAYLTRA